LFCLSVVHGLRYCSTQVFIHSVCPSVCGWNAVDRFCYTPRFLQSVLEKLDAKQESRSEMICLEIPNQGTRCFRYLLATPSLLIFFLHGMNLAALDILDP
jgi:hypothetical protein